MKFCLMLALTLASPALAQDAEEPKLTIELNALNQTEGACRLLFVARNGLAADVTSLVLEAVAFDASGSVNRIALFDFSSLPTGTPRVRQFDLPDLACSDIGSLLVNGVQSCEGPADCSAALSVSSRTDVELLG